MTGPQILVIGTGSIGKRHAQNLATLGARPVALSLRALGLDGVLRAVDTAPAQGAVIATASQLRQPLIVACAARGLPVYIEKPLAYRPDDLAALYAASHLAARSMAGFMMRYHPLLPHLLASAAEDDIYRFDLEIGHDVTQWRANWSFADSYAARAEGGGVLLDLCHELDLAHVMFPDVTLHRVDSLGHAAFPGVDMASAVSLAGPGRTGVVAMDYLSPVSLRRIRLRGQAGVTDCDLLAGRLVRQRTGAAPAVTEVTFDRNAMFLNAMRDFLALVDGRVPDAGSPRIPRLDLARPSSDLIAAAWSSRRFTGMIAKELT